MRINSEKDLISRDGVKAILRAHKRDEASAIAEAASDKTHNHVPVFQSLADSILTTPMSFPLFLQANQLKKKDRVLVILATLGSGYHHHHYQLGKKLNMSGDIYALMATHSITVLFHSVSPKKMSTLQDITETKTYFPENRQIFQNFGKRFRSNFGIIHPDEEHDEPGICASQAYDPVRDLFCKPNITNRFQRISAADPSSNLQFINCENFSTTVGFVDVTRKAHQSQYRIKEFELSESIDVEALHLNSIEISTKPWRSERRRRISTSRLEPIRMGLPNQSIFQDFVNVETNPRTNVVLEFSLEVFKVAMNIADFNNDSTYNFYLFDGKYDDLVKQIALWVRIQTS